MPEGYVSDVTVLVWHVCRHDQQREGTLLCLRVMSVMLLSFAGICPQKWSNNVEHTLAAILFRFSVTFVSVFLYILFPPPKGGRIFLMSPPVWKLRAVSLSPLFYISSFVLLPSVLLLFLSYPFLLLAHSSDFFFPKPPFSKR